MGIGSTAKHIAGDIIGAAIHSLAEQVLAAVLGGKTPTAEQLELVKRDVLAAARARAIAEAQNALAFELLPGKLAEMYASASKVTDAFVVKGAIAPLGVVEEVASDDFERIVVENKEREERGEIIR